MKKIGIIGGLGPESTIDYYKEIISCFNTDTSAENIEYPEIIIYSVQMSKFIGYLQKGEYEQVIEYLSQSINKLKDAGADFAAISSNTPHLLFSEIQQKCKLPLISIVESACEEAQRQGLRRVGLFGTKFTMQASFYQNVFQPHGIEIVVPNEKEIALIHEKLFTELELGIIKSETQKVLLNIVQRIIDEEHIDSLILGCTEFPLMFTQDHYLGIPFLNTTRIHVKNIVKECLS